jgi:sugar/nucleoside kinase (ribokinase family)
LSILKFDLICLGNLTIDDIVLPDGTKQWGCFGGDTVYSALGAALWSDQVGFVAPVGNDFPHENLAQFQTSGWDTRGLAKRSIPTMHNVVTYKDDNDRVWVVVSDPNDFFELSPALQDIPPDYLQSRAFMLLAMDLAAQENLVPPLRKFGLVAVDPQEDYIAGNIARIHAMLKNVDIFLPGQEEVFRILGHRDYEKACLQFAEDGAGVVVVKMGADGSLIYSPAEEKYWQIPAYKTTVVDPTGAGDAYCGGFMAKYAQTGDLIASGLAGTVSASFAIEEFGLSHMFTLDKHLAQQRYEQLRTATLE